MKTENTAPDNSQQADENLSLEESLSATFDEMDTTDDGGDVESEIEFTGDDNEEVEVSAEDETQTDQEDEQDQAQEEVDQIRADGEYNEPAPERWPEEYQEYYNQLDPKGKEIFLDKMFKPMQRKYTEATQALAHEKRNLEPMLKTLERHSEEFKQAGINPVEAFNRQMAWSAHFAKVGPEQGAKDLAAAYGQAGGQHGDGPGNKSDVYMTPVEKAQQAEIDRLKAETQNLNLTEQQRREDARRDAQARQANQVRESISKFANEMRDGKPVHPHVEKLGPQMAGLIRGGLVDRVDEYGQPVPYSQQLGQAYKIACEMDPNIRTQRQTRSRREQVARVTAAGREVVSKAPGTSDNVPDNRPLADSISDLYDRLDKSAA